MFAAARIWFYCLFLIETAFVLWILVLRHMDAAPAVDIGIPWWGLALVFCLAEAYVVHVHFTREAHTISLSEVGLVVGLFVLSPGGLLVAQLLGAGTAFAFVRRQRAAKLVFNVSQLALTTSVVLIVFRSLADLGHPFNLAGWGAALLAAVTGSLLGIIPVVGAIGLAEGEIAVRQMVTAAGISIVATIGVSNLVLVAIELARGSVRSLVLLVLPGVIGVMALRAYGAQARRHEHLQFLYESMKATQGAPEFSLAVGQLLITIRQLVRAEYAEIFLFPTETEPGLRSAMGAHGDLAAHVDTRSPADEQVLEALGSGSDALLLPAPRAPHPLDGYLAVRKLPDGIFAALRGENGPFGLLVVGDRSSDVDSFNQDDQRLLETFVGHASVMIENGRLERSLAEVTDLKERLRHQAYHDALTGLPNRALLTERVEAAIGRDESAALLFLDLDDFKTINDTLGHAVGDEVLAEVARRVERAIRPGDIAARLGGDEFAVLLEGADERGTEVIAESLMRAMQRPFSLHGQETLIHASVGVALASSATSADELLRNADVAMYSAKAQGKHCFAQYEPTMHARVRKRHEFALELWGALDRDEIKVVFEPIVNLRDGKIIAFEALARWHSVELGVVQPSEFIPVAEEIGMMIPIGNAVLRQACFAARAWQDRHPGYGDVGVSVNLSPTELASDQLADSVARVLFESRLPVESLMLEVTESDVMWDIDSSQLRMDELRTLGVRLVLDDFGTGRSSLERLDSFPLNAVKIAKPFVDHLLDPACESGFIDAFVRLAYSLEMQCIAEGIEHEAQVPRLLDRGCALGQGFLFASPMSEAQLDAYLGSDAGRLRATP